MLHSELYATLHTLTCVATSHIPVVVALSFRNLVLLMAAKSTNCIVLTAGGTSSLDVNLFFHIMRGLIINGLLFVCATSVSASYLLKTVGLGSAIYFNKNFLIAPESVCLGINSDLYSIVVITVDTLENCYTGSYTVSCYKLGMIPSIFFILVLALATYRTYMINVAVAERLTYVAPAI